MDFFPFFPIFGRTVSLGGTDSSANTSIDMDNATSVMIYNKGSSTAYVKWDKSSATATTADCPIPAGAQVVFSASNQATSLAVICESTETTTIKITPGRGL